MKLTLLAKTELQWWLGNIATSYRPISQRPFHKNIASDASGLGWGATDGTTHIGGRWTALEKVRAENNEINYLELLAAFHALRSFCSKEQNINIHLKLDNTTAVAYLNNMGGIKSIACNALAIEIWSWCSRRSIWVFASHLPGAQNTVADRMSRQFNDELEWMLNKQIFHEITYFWLA